MALFDFSSDSAPGCFVAAKANSGIAPTHVGAGSPHLPNPTPVVTVRLSTLVGQNCSGTAEDTAVAAFKRAT